MRINTITYRISHEADLFEVDFSPEKYTDSDGKRKTGHSVEVWLCRSGGPIKLHDFGCSPRNSPSQKDAKFFLLKAIEFSTEKQET